VKRKDIDGIIINRQEKRWNDRTLTRERKKDFV
jgi:hypothetical protein